MMNNLIQHIEYLLLRHDYVYVPGIGAFVNIRHSAEFDERARLWYPMWREVRYSNSAGDNDGLLLRSIARKMQISPMQASEILATGVEEFQCVLAQNGEVAFGNLGIFARGINDELNFRSYSSRRQFGELYGYQPASVGDSAMPHHETEKSTDDKEVRSVAVTQEPEVGQIGATQAAQTGQEKRKFDTEKNYYIPVNKVFAKVAASVAIVLAVGLSLILPSSESNRREQAAIVSVDGVVDAAKNIITDPDYTVNDSKSDQNDIADKDAQRVNSASIPAIETVSDHQPNTSDSQIKDRAHSYLIVATFRSEAEAERFVEQNYGCGYQLEVIPGRTLYRVSAKSAVEKQALYSLLNSTEFQQKFSQAWVWEDK